MGIWVVVKGSSALTHSSFFIINFFYFFTLSLIRCILGTIETSNSALNDPKIYELDERNPTRFSMFLNALLSVPPGRTDLFTAEEAVIATKND